VPHIHQAATLVVLGDLLSRLQRYVKTERPHARCSDRDWHAYWRGGAIGGQFDLLARDHPPVSLDDERHALVFVTSLPDQDARQKSTSLEHLARHLHAFDLHVPLEAVRADTHREHGNCAGAQRCQLRRHSLTRVVRAVAQDHEARERNRIELLPRSADCIAKSRLGGVEAKLRDILDAPESRAEAEKPDLKLLAQRGH
jgi:hypothetical protein